MRQNNNPQLINQIFTSMQVLEWRLYKHLLSVDHAKDPMRLVYEVPFEKIDTDLDPATLPQVKQRRMRDAEQLTSRSFELTTEGALSPFSGIILEDYSYQVHLSESFKKLLILL